MTDLQAFLIMLGEPLGWKSKHYLDNQERQDEFLEELHVPTYNFFQDVNFYDVL